MHVVVLEEREAAGHQTATRHQESAAPGSGVDEAELLPGVGVGGSEPLGEGHALHDRGQQPGCS